MNLLVILEIDWIHHPFMAICKRASSWRNKRAMAAICELQAPFVPRAISPHKIHPLDNGLPLGSGSCGFSDAETTLAEIWPCLIAAA